jgi:hypothetical protein
MKRAKEFSKNSKPMPEYLYFMTKIVTSDFLSFTLNIQVYTGSGAVLKGSPIL